jgi:hypothetical protein
LIYITTHTFAEAVEFKQWCADNAIRVKASYHVGQTAKSMVHVVTPTDKQEMLVKLRWNRP